MLREPDLSLLVDLYELAMAQAYWSDNRNERACFSLFFRSLPSQRNFMLACGQQHVAEVIRGLRFGEEQLRRLEALDMFRRPFLDWLADFQFSGDIHALPEGTPVFPQEPLLELEAPIIEGQILESLIMNYVHLETVLASKAIRLKLAAGDRPVVDFGMRRMHGLDAAYRGVRAYRVAGLAGTSNILAGQDFGLPVRGTMAHSFVQAHDDELEAFKTYAALYPGTTLLVDTYDTEAAVARIIDWLDREPAVKIGAIRLDSGDLAGQARRCRKMLDQAGHGDIRILASGGLDEYRIQAMLADNVPIDGFGVGTAIGAASDAPSLELAYKLTEYAGRPRLKNSPGKASWPGRKQVYRQRDGQGNYRGDQIVARDEEAPGEPLLKPVLLGGKPVEGAIQPLDRAAAHTADAVGRLPASVRGLQTASRPYPVTMSKKLKALRRGNAIGERSPKGE